MVVLVACALAARAEVPHGWFLAGSKPSEFEAGVDKGKEMGVAFDNMQDRAIKGTTDWRLYEVVLDVPEDATGIASGILLTGAGEVWLNGARFEVVGPDVAVTGSKNAKTPDKPVNLDFAE